jgi:hypothetical protein
VTRVEPAGGLRDRNRGPLDADQALSTVAGGEPRNIHPGAEGDNGWRLDVYVASATRGQGVGDDKGFHRLKPDGGPYADALENW